MKNLEHTIRECRNNNRASQNALFYHFTDYLMNLILRYVHNKQDAKEIFLTSFELAFRKIDQYDASRGHFKSWLSKIAINQCLAFIKKKKMFFVDESYINETDYSDPYLEELDAEYLYTLIKCLGEPYNLVFNMVIDGYKHKEIGQLLGIKESTSRSYYLRARNKLKQQIQENFKLNAT